MARPQRPDTHMVLGPQPDGTALPGHVITNLTGATNNHYLHDYMGIPADSSMVVYFSGATTSAYQGAMMGVLLKAPTTPQVIYKGAGAATYWIVLGVK